MYNNDFNNGYSNQDNNSFNGYNNYNSYSNQPTQQFNPNPYNTTSYNGNTINFQPNTKKKKKLPLSLHIIFWIIILLLLCCIAGGLNILELREDIKDGKYDEVLLENQNNDLENEENIIDNEENISIENNENVNEEQENIESEILNENNEQQEDVVLEENNEQEIVVEDNVEYMQSDDAILSKVPVTHVDGVVNNYHVNTALGFYFPLTETVRPMARDFLNAKLEPFLAKNTYCAYTIGQNDFCVVCIYDYKDLPSTVVEGDFIDFIGYAMLAQGSTKYKSANYEKVTYGSMELGYLEFGDRRIYLKQYDNYVMQLIAYGPQDSVDFENFMNSITWFEPNIEYMQYLNTIAYDEIPE